MANSRRCLVLVDAGYLYGSASDPSRQTPGARPLTDNARIIEDLAKWVRELPADLVGISWYDAGLRRQPDIHHQAIAALPAVSVQLGALTKSGQKGVDGLILADMFRLAFAPQALVTDVLLVAGDSDLLPGLEAVRGSGVSVHLMGDGQVNQAKELLFAAPFTTPFPEGMLDTPDVGEFEPSRAALERVVVDFVNTLRVDLTDADVDTLLENRPLLRYKDDDYVVNVDAALLRYISHQFQISSLASKTRHLARRLFWEVLTARVQ